MALNTIIIMPPTSVRYIGNNISYITYMLGQTHIKKLSKLIAIIFGSSYNMIVREWDGWLTLKYKIKILDLGVRSNLKRSFGVSYSTTYESNSELFKRYPMNVRRIK